MYQRKFILVIAIAFLLLALVVDIWWGLGNALTMKYDIEHHMMLNNNWHTDYAFVERYNEVKNIDTIVIAIFIADLGLIATTVYFLFRGKELAK